MKSVIVLFVRRHVVVSFPLVAAAVALAGVSSLSAREGGVLLKHKLTAGSEYQIQQNMDLTMKLPMGGRDSALGDQRVEAEQLVSIKVIPHEDGEHKRVDFMVDRIRMDVSVAGVEMRYDSSDPGSSETMLGAAFKHLIGRTVHLLYDENDAFVSIENPEVLRAEKSPGIGQKFDVDQIKQLVSSSMLLGFPDSPVAAGDHWDRTVEIPMQGLGSLEFNMRYSYERDETVEGHDCAVVGISGDMKGEVETTKDGIPLKAMRIFGDFKSSRIEGKVFFDKEYGIDRTLEMDMDVILTMPSPEGPDQSLEMPINQKVKTSLLSFRVL